MRLTIYYDAKTKTLIAIDEVNNVKLRQITHNEPFDFIGAEKRIALDKFIHCFIDNILQKLLEKGGIYEIYQVYPHTISVDFHFPAYKLFQLLEKECGHPTFGSE